MIKILINVLDDQRWILDEINNVFATDDRFEIKYFTSPDEFISQFSKNVDLFITDIRIPGYDVLETIRFIATYNPSCYIFVMSAYFDADILKEFIKYRVDAVIEKTHELGYINELKERVVEFMPKLLLNSKTRQNDY